MCQCGKSPWVTLFGVHMVLDFIVENVTLFPCFWVAGLIGGRVFNPRLAISKYYLLLPRVKNPPPNQDYYFTNFLPLALM